MTGVLGSVFYFDWEVAFMEWFQSILPSSSVFASILNFFSMFGEQLVMVAVLGFLYWCWDKDFGEYVGLNVVTVSLWNPMVKNICLRRRPYFDNSGIHCLRPVEKGADIYDIEAQGFSFPSGHSSSAVTLYGSLASYTRKRIFLLLALILPLLVGISRVYVGVHYPTDVLCGWLLGLLVILVLNLLRKAIRNQTLLFAVLLLTGLPGFFYCRSSDYYTSYGMLFGFCTAILFEKRFVHFENTRSPIRMILRMAGGIAIYFGLNTLLKLPFPSALLASASTASRLIRCGRYAVVTFTDIAIYPMVFKVTARIGRKKET
jgi:undecaprenyl-diphosphatase